MALTPSQTEVALVSSSVTPTNPALKTKAASGGHAADTPVPGQSLPLPGPANAGAGSPLVDTQPLTPGVQLTPTGALPDDPGLLPVITPVVPEADARGVLAQYGFVTSPLTGAPDGTASVSATTVLSNRRPYRVTLQAQSYGYHLMLKLLAPPPQTSSGRFDAEANARAFLRAHNLAEDLGSATVSTLTEGTTITFTTTLSNTYEAAGLDDTLTFTPAGVLKSADLHIIDQSSPPLYSGISAAAALAQVKAGYGLVSLTDGAVLGSTASVTGTVTLYIPVTAEDGTYLEPVYRFTGTTDDGTAFAIYVSALDRSYLR
jgi:hypothetical protein